MDNYFLIARNKMTNEFDILSINEQWYLGDDGKDVFHRSSSLPVIDLITSCFKSREEMAKRLFDKGYINDPNVDIFIARKVNIDGKPTIKFKEVIYNPTNNSRMLKARKIFQAAANGNMTLENDSISYIYGEFINKIFDIEDLWTMVETGDMSADPYLTSRLSSAKDSDLKKINFISKRYSIFRGIVETLNRFELFSETSGRYRVDRNSNYVYLMQRQREFLIDQLLIQLDKDYDENQLSLFDFDKEQEQNKKDAKVKKDLFKEELELATKSLVNDASLIGTMSIDGKKKYVYQFLENLPIDAFYYDSAQNKFLINYSVFKHPLLEDEIQQLNSLLTGNMPKFFSTFSLYRVRAREAESFCGISEVEELKHMADCSIRSISKRFRSDKCVSMTYKWCRLYDACMKRDKEYQKSGINNGGESSGKVYNKK